MKQLSFAAALASMAIGASAFGADIGVSINVGEPGFFGRIDLGDAPAPRFINSAPVIGIRVPGVAVGAPIYLHVRPGYERNWRRHCHEYNACGQPVYFVQDSWYNDAYVPHYRERHGDHMDHRAGREDRPDNGGHRGPGDHRDDGDRHDDHRDH
jgi:hypothetical protein